MNVVKLQAGCEDIFTGIPPRLRAAAVDPEDSRGVPLVGIRTITRDGWIDPALTERFVPTGALPDSAQALRKGDVLLSIRGSLPKSAFVEEALPTQTFASGNLVVLRPKDGVLDPGYLWSFLLSICHDTHHPLLTRASTQQLSIRMADLQNLRIPLPPLEYQQAIGHTALVLRNAIRAERYALAAGERTYTVFLRESFLS